MRAFSLSVWRVRDMPRCWSATLNVRGFSNGGCSGAYGLNSTNAVGLTKRLGDLSDMIHFVWGYRGWRLERFINGNGIIVAQRQSGSFNYPSGSYELSFNFASGKVYVKDPEGILTECDWNNTQDAGLLSDYNTNSFFYEIISSGDDELITTYSRCYARD